MKKFFIASFSFALLFAGQTVFAEYSCNDFSSIGGVLTFFTCTINNVVVNLLFSIAMVAFIYGIIQYFLFPDNEEKRKQGKSYMMWGLISLFVMVSMWGIVNIFTSTFQLRNSAPGIPQLN